MSGPVYPRIPRNEWKNVKIDLDEYSKIRELRESGLTYGAIGEIYDVSSVSIYYIVNPDKYNINKVNSVRLEKKKLQTDKAYRAKKLRYKSKYSLEQRAARPELREFHKAVSVIQWKQTLDKRKRVSNDE